MGMIIVGYQGIGKSTLSKSGVGRYIDLESSNFYVHGTRPTGWEILYCKLAKNLADQGYVVFVSSHLPIRIELGRIGCDFTAIVPAQELKDVWVAKLKNRFFESESDKDYRAWQNAKDDYNQNVAELMDDVSDCYVIREENYDLESIVRSIIDGKNNESTE